MKKKLSDAQLRALSDAAAAPLELMRCGWSSTGARGFPLRTVKILARHKLLTLRPHPDDNSRCRFHITEAGRGALNG